MNLEELNIVDKLINKYNGLEIKNKFLKENVDKEIDYSEIKYLIHYGNLLSISNKSKNRKRALDIATIIPNIIKERNIIISCKIILIKLRSFLTVNRLNELYPDSTYKNLSIVEKLRNEYIEIGNTVSIQNKDVILSNTQYNIYKLLESNKNISISAPTSAGKSYIIMRILIDILEKSKKSMVYIVPTRALINQVISDLRNHIDKDRFFISSSSDTKRLDENKIGIFVLTQERLYQLCNNNEVDIGTLIVDEAHNIMDGSRGVLLEYSIKYSNKIWNKLRIIFLSPLVSNPEKLFEKFNYKNNESYNALDIPVRQNIIKLEWIKNKGYNVLLNNNIIKENLKIRRGNNLKECIVNVFLEFNNNEKSIIYCNTAKATQDICNELYQRSEIEDKKEERLEEFSKFIEKYIHKNFKLVNFIKRGIAFHYGALPSFIRLGIEELATDGLLDIIVSTSTLLQGINIPVQNIYIYIPKKTKKEGLNNLDFWNLVGRAGRTGYDLCGNVIIVDTKSWDNINKYDNKEMKLDYATNLNEEELNELEEVIISNKYEDSKKREFIENIESGLLFDTILDTKTQQIDSEVVNEFIKDTIEKYADIKNLLIKLLGFKAENIYSIWEIFENDDENIEKYIIPHPYSENFWNSFGKIIYLINKNLMNGNLYWEEENIIYTKNKSFIKLLTCALKWMQGNELKKILFYNFNNFKNEDEVTKIVGKQIKYIDDNIRYKLVKSVYAYQEILKEYLVKTQKDELLDKMVNIPTFLELGACDEVSIELISLGLMREIALKISGKIKVKDNDIIKGLKILDLESLDLSKYEVKILRDFIEKLN